MARIELRKGHTLILHGPASAILVEGKASVLGCPLSSRRRLVVKSWRSRPIYAEEDSVIEFAFGEGGGYEVVEGDTIPPEWRSLADKISAKPSKLCVYGGVDSGKTSLATLMANSIAKSLGSAIYLDLDLGQSSICPPTTIGCVSLRAPIPDISHLRMEFGEVVGYTSPAPLVEKHLEAVEKVAKRIAERYPGVGACADLDGWVSGRQALRHKQALLDILKPDHLAAIGDLPEEIRSRCEELGIDYELLPPPRSVRERERQARKRLREIAYERFLRKVVVRKIPISWVKLKSITGFEDPGKIKKHVWKIIQGYSEESGEVFDDEKEALEELARKGVGLLCYLRDASGEFLGIGLLTSLDFGKNYLRITTPYAGQIGELILGAVLLSIDGEEVYSNPSILLERDLSP